MVKMSSESKAIKPKTDFELILNYSNHCICKKLKNDTGAGANAACIVHKTFSTSEPLSEIVWSPDKGFSLKCVDSSFTNKNTSLFGNVEPSSMVLALLQSVTDGSSTTNKPIEDVFVEPIAVICSKNDVSSTDTPTRNPASDSVVIIPDHKTCEEHRNIGFDDNMEKMNIARAMPNLPNGEKEIVTNDTEKNICDQANIKTAIMSGIRGNKSTISGNDLHTLNYDATCAATSTILVSKSNEDKNISPANEMLLVCNNMTRNEGEEKSLSDGDSNASLPKDNDFHLSVESCHSTRLVLAGKKRCNFQQQLKIGSKKLKKLTQEASCSKSHLNRDSSFMNLISSMMKGCSQSTQDEDESLPLNLENYNDHLQWPDQKLISYNKNQYQELKDAGFRSNFQSMAGAKLKNVGTRMSQVGEASKDSELGNKEHGINITPITFYEENNSLHRKYLQSNKLELSEGKHDAYLPSRPQIRPINSLNNHEHWKNNLLENENCYNSELSKENEGMALLSLHPSPSTRQNSENVESYAMYERKEGLWINRFLPKSTSPLTDFDHPNERGGSEVYSSSCAMLPHSLNHISLNNCKIEEAREQSDDDQLLSEAKNLHNCCINKEDSNVLKDDKGNQYHTPKHRFNSFKPFPGLRDSGPMVSMFARRLGAIKQCQHTE